MRPARTTRSRRGFTLVEVLIAVAIGAVVVVTAWEGLRVASQSVSAARRLSLQNAMLRAGYDRAHDCIDTWLDLDDPVAGGNQALRQTSVRDGVTQGLPFTPLPAPSGGSGSGSGSSSSGDENARGWDASYKWPANDPRTWQRVNAVESMDGDLRLGRWAIFSATDPSLRAQCDGALLPVGAAADYGTVAVPHTWLANQQRDLIHALQFYGAVAYLPANALYGWYRPWQAATLGSAEVDAGTDAGGIPLLIGHHDTPFVNGDGTQLTVRGLWRLTQGSVYAIARPDGPSGGGADALRDAQHALWNVGYASNLDSMTAYKRATTVPAQLLPLAPSGWPVASVSVARYVKSRRFIALATVRWADPATGEACGVSFSTYGTDLRGARQQRAAAGGWARWDDSVSAANDPTLDGAAP